MQERSANLKGGTVGDIRRHDVDILETRDGRIEVAGASGVPDDRDDSDIRSTSLQRTH